MFEKSVDRYEHRCSEGELCVSESTVRVNCLNESLIDTHSLEPGFKLWFIIQLGRIMILYVRLTSGTGI